MNQNLSSYWIFYTVANAGNISKAAKELYISQPAISKSIQKLEDGLECKLFSRSSRGVVLTDEGRLLYDHVSEATLCKYMLLPYLKEFIHRNPHISISIECQSTNETLKLLDDDKIDIGLIGKPASLKTFNFYYLDNIEDIFVTTKDYLRNLSARGVKKSEILDLLIDFAKIGVGVACVIKSIVSKELADGTLIEIPLGIPIHKREVGFAYKESSKLSTSLQTFIKFYESYTPEDF